jgi:outer membrane protein OmpA-like peptidoglycan-associated protein
MTLQTAKDPSCSRVRVQSSGGAALCKLVASVALGVLCATASSPALALDLGDLAKKAVGGAASGAKDKVFKEVNAKLLAEGRKNQCSFKTDSDELAPGCDNKLRNLANTLVEMKKRLKVAGVTDFKFEVSGHTDSSGSAEHNKELSGKRAATIVREMVARGIPESEIISVGMGADRPLVKPDDTPAKKAKNRRYEIQVR